MKIAHFTHSAELYGANLSLLSLVRGMRERGHESMVIVPRSGPMSRELQRSGIPHRVRPHRWWMSPSRFGRIPRLAMNGVLALVLAWELRRWGVQVIHSNSSVIPLGAFVSRLLGRPHVWHVREFGDLDYGLQKDWGQDAFVRAVERSAAVVAVSKAVRRRVLDDVDVNVRLVYNGILTEEESASLARETGPDEVGRGAPFMFAILGLLSPAKGQADAIRALAGLDELGERGARLLVAGAGNRAYGRELRELRAELDLEDHVEFLGYVDDPFDVYGRADAVLMCSRCEAMGRTTVEAMFAGRPVIGRNSGATPELVEDGRTGLLYDGSVRDLSDSMVEIAADPERARRLGRAGRGVARSRFTVEEYVRKVDDILDQVTARSRAVP